MNDPLDSVTTAAIDPLFLFATCQVGAELALKQEVQLSFPAARPAFSRPGFVTFKFAEGRTAGPPVSPPTARLGVFARAWGISQGPQAADAALAAARLAVLQPDVLHVWHKDRAAPGQFHFEPGPLPEDSTRGEQILAAWPGEKVPALRPAVRGERVADCIVLGPEEWWLGEHQAFDYSSCLIGGQQLLTLPFVPVSRAAYKLEDALRFSGLPLRAGEVAAELGCAPGGAAQVLLQRGLSVIGVDPADVAEEVVSHPKFLHLRKRGHEVRCREFRKVRWLFADINLPPTYTLDSVERIVMHPETRVRGLIATLKLVDWSLAGTLPELLERVRSWGFDRVLAAQLQYHRQEICVVAEASRKERR